MAAAVSAARSGASVILLEKNWFLGGLWTGGLVLPVIDHEGAAPDGSVVTTLTGFGMEVCGRLREMGMIVRNGAHPIVDPEATKYVLDRFIAESGVRMLYNIYVTQVLMSGDRIDCLICESKSGRCAIRASRVVDCSGDGDVIEWAGESFEHRRHHIGAMWRVGGVTAGCKDATPIKGVYVRHLRGELDQDGLDVFNTSRLQQQYREHIWEDTQKLKTLPGNEDAFLLESPPMLGVRVTRVLDSLHNVRYEDYRGYKEYEDSIGMSGSGGGKKPYWQIPYRSLLPKKCPNLIVAGRCFGYEEKVTYDAREIATCLVTGQAAGVAAALSSARRCSLQELGIDVLQSELRAQLSHGFIRKPQHKVVKRKIGEDAGISGYPFDVLEIVHGPRRKPGEDFVLDATRIMEFVLIGERGFKIVEVGLPPPRDVFGESGEDGVRFFLGAEGQIRIDGVLVLLFHHDQTRGNDGRKHRGNLMADGRGDVDR